MVIAATGTRLDLLTISKAIGLIEPGWKTPSTIAGATNSGEQSSLQQVEQTSE
jgi:hypothetical protein